MKTLINKTTSINLTSESEKKTKFADFCESCIKDVPEKGVDLNEMKVRLDILDKLKTAKKDIKFENAEAELLKRIVKETRWKILHEDIVDFLEHVEKL